MFAEIAEIEEQMESHDHREFESCELCGEKGKWAQLQAAYDHEAKFSAYSLAKAIVAGTHPPQEGRKS